MPIPKTRQELVDSMLESYARLKRETELLDDEQSKLECVEDWSIKDMLAVRVWWTDRVCDWIESGRRGEIPVTPAVGYSWRETPRLNSDIVDASKNTPLSEILARLESGYNRALTIVRSLDDRELLDSRVFGWAGKLPLVRWISINTTRQYVTARTYIRRAIKAQSGA